MTRSAQRIRILEQLRHGPVSTIDAIRMMNILRPAARVHELRNMGHNIVTHWDSEPLHGSNHKVARYVLLS